MIIPYTIFNILILVLCKKSYKSLYNPVSIYAFVWELAIILHESGLIVYYQLTGLCWLMIFLFEIVFLFGILIGGRISIGKESKSDGVHCINSKIEKEQLSKWIIITLVICGVGIVGSVLKAINLYGRNLLKATANIYANRVYNGEDLQLIPYIDSFIYVEMTLAGVYVKKYGFKPLLLVGFALVFLNSLTSGGRAGIVFNAILFVSAFMLTKNTNRQTKKLSFKQKIIITVAGVAVFAMIYSITAQRVSGVSLGYATKRFTSMFGDNVLIYKGISYISNPIGALNEYLKDMTFSFGHNTFLPIYNVLARIGIIERIEQYQSWFYMPMGCNVATWIRELIEDFTIPGAIVFAILFSMTVGYQYKGAIKKQNIAQIVISSVFIMIIALSFFDWRMRTSGMWIAIFFGYFIGRSIDKKSQSVYEGNKWSRRV